eukprot:775173-Pelagomonas_calceolata.AAC.3
MPRGSAAASLAALHRHGSTAFLITSLKSPSAEPSFQAKLRATARSAHLSTTTHTSSGGAAAAAASKKNVAATSKAAMSTASATPVPHVTPATSAPHYRGIVHALTHIVQQEGVLGLYRGLGATLLQVSMCTGHVYRHAGVHRRMGKTSTGRSFVQRCAGVQAYGCAGVHRPTGETSTAWTWLVCARAAFSTFMQHMAEEVLNQLVSIPDTHIASLESRSRCANNSAKPQWR